MSTTRITINIDDEILPLLEQEREKRKIARAHTAGEIIKEYFTSKPCSDESINTEYEAKIQYLESEVQELKEDKRYLQGEVSKLTDGILTRLPAPIEKRSFVWPWSRK